MLRKFIYPILLLPFCLYIASDKSLLSQTKNNIDLVAQGPKDKLFIDYSKIENIVSQNNLELKSLKNLLSSATFNLSSRSSSCE